MRPFDVLRMRKAAPAVTVSIAPSSQVAGPAANAGWTFGTTTITVTGGTPTSYVWSAAGDGVGNWGVSGGQGTATATCGVSLMPEGETGSCDFSCTVTVGGVGYTRSAFHQYSRTGSPE